MRAAALGIQLQTMLGERVGVGWSEVNGVEGLFPVEAAAVARAVPKRQAEFAAGRRAARAALAAIDAGEPEIEVGPRRAPAWPQGVTGAITHDRDVALAAVMPKAAGALGIDLTEAAPLPDGTRATILPHPEEGPLTDLEARAAFSAKESLFKAISPITEAYFGFDAAVFAPGIGGRFTLWLTAPLGPFCAGTDWTGTIAVEGRHLLTAIVVPLGDRP